MRILRGVLALTALSCATAAAVAGASAVDGTLPALPALPKLEAVVNPNSCLPAAGSRGWCGDGDSAKDARLAGPRDVAPLAGGAYLVADTLNHVVRRVDVAGVITTVAGNAAAGSSGDGGPASDARLNAPTGVAAEGDGGGFVVADAAAHVVRRVDADGTIRRLAGTGRAGGSGDGGPALRATLRAPRAVATLPDGSVLIADAEDHRVRRVAPDGTISAFAGSGASGNDGDGGPAVAASLVEPSYLSLEPGGSVLVADRAGARVRRVNSDGTIATVAGGELPGTPATALRLEFPAGVSSTGDGGFLVTEATLVRQVLPDGTTRIAAGTGTAGFNGDRSLALLTQLTLPAAVAWIGNGDALVADASNDRIRRFNIFGGIRTIAGFDRPDQVLGVPPVPAPAGAGAGAGQVTAIASGSRCSERSQAGRYNVLRIRPSASLSVRRRAPVTLFVESSSAARVRMTVAPPGSGAHPPASLSVAVGRKTIALGRLRKRGSYRVRVTATLAQAPRASRCAERVLRVR